MKNTISVFVGVDEFECRQYNGGVDVYDANTNKYIGDIAELSIPDIDDIEENVKFNDVVENWLSEKYY